MSLWSRVAPRGRFSSPRAGQFDAPGGHNFRPALVAEVELGEPLQLIPAVTGGKGSYERALVLVRLHTRPLGIVECYLDDGSIDAARLAEAIWDALRQEISRHLQLDGHSPVSPPPAGGYQSAETPACLTARARLLDDPPRLSVVVPTRERPERLEAGLGSLLALDYPAYEILVVDNAPGADSATRSLVERLARGQIPLRYLHEPRPGASAARNLGLKQARNALVAFTDDDVLVDRHWLSAIAEGFQSSDDVACVTGPIFPAKLETPAQHWMTQYAELRSGFHREVFDLQKHRSNQPLYPYNPGVFGSGGSMAFDKPALEAIGGFDPALGPATPARSGEELAAFFAIVQAGHKLVFEPGAFVYHAEELDYDALEKRAYAYGVGLTAYLTKSLLDNPKLVLDFARQMPRGVYLTLAPGSPKHASKDSSFPRELNRSELKGMFLGPLAYGWGRLRGR